MNETDRMSQRAILERVLSKVSKEDRENIDTLQNEFSIIKGTDDINTNSYTLLILINRLNNRINELENKIKEMS